MRHKSLCARIRSGLRSLPRSSRLAETYQFYELPFCQPKGGHKHVDQDLGEVLEGDRIASTPYNIK